MNLLLVEDDPSFGPLLEILLSDTGHDVFQVDTAEAALTRLFLFDYDAMITDIALPTMSGAELARKARVSVPNLWIVFISGSRDDPSAEFRPRASFLPKPFDVPELEEILNDIERGR